MDQISRLVEGKAWNLLERPRRVLISEVCQLVQVTMLRAVKGALLTARPEDLVVVDVGTARGWWESRLPAGVRFVPPATWARRPGLVIPTDHLFAVGDSLTLSNDTTQWSVFAQAFRTYPWVRLGVCTHAFPKAVHQVDLVEHMDRAVYLHREEIPGLAARDAQALGVALEQLTAVN